MTSYRRWAARPDAARRALRQVRRHAMERGPDESHLDWFKEFAERLAAMPIAATEAPGLCKVTGHVQQVNGMCALCRRNERAT